MRKLLKFKNNAGEDSVVPSFPYKKSFTVHGHVNLIIKFSSRTVQRIYQN